MSIRPCNPRARSVECILATLLLSCALPAQALGTDRNQPMDVSANYSRINQGGGGKPGTTFLRGDVRVVQGTMKANAAEATIEQDANGAIRRVILVGMGNLGTALARFPSFNSDAFQVVAGFDADIAKVGRRVGQVPTYAMSELRRVVAESGAEMAVLAVPAATAAAAHAAIVAAGIRAVLNFAPVSLPSSADCKVKNLDLRIHLEELAFFLEADAPDDR